MMEAVAYSEISEVSFDMTTTRVLNETPSSVIVKSNDDYNPEVSIKKTPSKEWEFTDMVSEVSFDMTNTRVLNETPSSVIVKSNDDYNPEVSIKKTPSKEWELDVRALISTKKWLQNYGLQKNKLSIKQILPAIGFKMSEDFDWTVKRPVSSRYAEGLFNQIMKPDGKMYNITCGRDKLRQLEGRMSQAIHLYKRRLEWLTSESRRLFGVVEERAITIVLDIRNMSPQQFDLYRMALERVLYEQVTQIAKFNLIRAADDMKMYQENCVPVTHDTIEGAIKWLWDLDRLAGVSSTACVEAVLRAIEDQQNEAIYLYTEGSSVDTCRQLLKEKICAVKKKPPIHAVSYNCDNSETVMFLREFATSTGGKYHIYAVIMEMDSYEGLPVDPNTNRANIMLKKKTFGGIPPGAGVREDVILLFQEIEEARVTLGQIQKLIGSTPQPNIILESQLAPVVDMSKVNEQYMSSRHWLEKYGLSARKLELFDILGGVAFHHKDGVVDILKQPLDEHQTDAILTRKLVNAKYCEDLFPVVKWRDGKVVHVLVTSELHRTYEQRMLVALRAIQNRIDWLNQGSRALFGTLIEDQIYILIDTSESMVPSIQYVKDRLFLLMQEQLRYKMKFNLIAFNSKVQVWQNRLVEVTQTSLEGSWKWIQGLSCWGSTNTYSALQHALGDPGTQAIYLLTDGRPDEPPKTIIAQVQMQHSVPVHTISFNCNDTEANQFLYDLARATGGRYHYFSEKGIDLEGQPESWESEDIRMLKDELRQGLADLDKVAELRDECAKLSWKKEIDNLKKCSSNHPMPQTDRLSAEPSMDPRELYRSRSDTPPPRPSSAPPDREHTPIPPPKLAASMDSRSFTKAKRQLTSRRSSSARPGSARGPMKPLAAGHTRTSLLRTLNSRGSFDPNEWLLPESRQLFEKQAERQKKLAQVETREARAMAARRRPRSKKSRYTSSKEWLQKNGLVAHKMTLLDALAPTAIPHKAKYVPILDKHVLSKVFDEVLPIAHVSNKSRRPIKLINPNGANLKVYEEKLQRLRAMYNRRLDAMVWETIPRETKEEEFGDAEVPVSFLNNRRWFMKALEEAGWPINEQDIMLMETEIERAEKYLQQSKDLRKAANNEDSDDEVTVYDDKASNVSGLSGKSKEIYQSRETLQRGSLESEDIRMLKDELRQGLTDLDKVAELRDECAKLSWEKEIDNLKKCSRNHPMPQTDRLSAVPSMDPRELYLSRSDTPPPRPSSAPPDREHTPIPPPKLAASMDSRSFTKAKRPVTSRRSSSARGPMKPLAAGHTRTSLLRTLNSQGSSDPNEWLLPETRQLVEKQAERQKELAQVEAREARAMAARRRPRSKKSRYTSSKEWLKKNGLVAHKMTLLDALAPTAIPHKAKYVPILDKNVLSKVSDEVLPIAHVSNKSRRPIKLINPNGANLKVYEEKLQRLIAMYNRRLDAMVWETIPRETKEEEFGDAEVPVSFLNNRRWFMKALEEAGWPINEQDIMLMETEIERAEKYLQQSKDLRKAANNEDSDDEVTVYDDKASNVSGLSGKSKEIYQSRESLQRGSLESEDTRMLKDELSQGLADLDKVAELRDECAKLSWKKEIDNLKKCSRNHPMPQTDRLSAVPSMDSRELYPSRSDTPPPRPSSAPPDREHTPIPPPKLAASVDSRSFTKAKRPVTSRRSSSARPGSARGPMKPLAAVETREARAMAARRRPRSKKSRYTSSKEWLQKNGLVAHKMTLLDALAPTAIPHKAKYVPILDKHVLSKVFDEVLPIAHVSHKSRRPIKLINPNGANLKVYEEKLQRLIAMYNRRLDAMVWETIPRETKQEEFGDAEVPVSFLNNRRWFMKALEEAGWPINEQDIMLMETEIERAEKYLQQSKDLRKAANNEDSDDEVTVYDDKASNVSGLSGKSKEIYQSRESLQRGSLELPISVSVKKHVRKPGSRGSFSDLERASGNESRVESDVTDKENKDMVGFPVIARYSKDGFYYPGNIVGNRESVYGLVRFNFMKKQKVPTQMIIPFLPISGAVLDLSFRIGRIYHGDFVLVRVHNQRRGVECYVPGIINFAPDTRQTTRYYSVLLYNGKTETTVWRSIVKIGCDRFVKAVKYIAHVQQARLRSKSRQKSRSRSFSWSRSRTQSESRSKSRQKSRSRSSSRSRSRTQSESRSKSWQKSRSRSFSRSRSRTQSESRSKSKQKSRSRSFSRSRSRTPSESSFRSYSSGTRSRSGSRSSSRSRSRTPTQRSRDRPVGSKSRSRSRSGERSSGSTTPRNSPIERPSNPVPQPRPVSPPLRTNSMVGNATRSDIYVESRESHFSSETRQAVFDEKDQMITDFQYQIEKQKRKHLRQEQRLVKQARHINKIQRRLERGQNNSSVHSDKSRSTRSSGDETDTSQHRRKGSPDGTSGRESIGLVGKQRSLPSVQRGQEVLARWIEDGWYYRRCVDGIIEDNRYIVRDATGHLEEVDQDDIIVEEQRKYYTVQPRDYVIGLHPKYVFSYAPAEILGTYINDQVKVEFYDGCTHTLSSDEVYKISKAKYESDRRYISSKDKQLVGKSVVARDNNTGTYKLGVVDSHCGLGQLYYVKWLDGMMCKQNAYHIFEVREGQRIGHDKWEYVLAPVDRSGMLYLPAQLEQGGRYVQFCDGSRSDVQREQCFWLSEQYYKNAVDYYAHMNTESGDQSH